MVSRWAVQSIQHEYIRVELYALEKSRIDAHGPAQCPTLPNAASSVLVSQDSTSSSAKAVGRQMFVKMVDPNEVGFVISYIRLCPYEKRGVTMTSFYRPLQTCPITKKGGGALFKP